MSLQFTAITTTEPVIAHLVNTITERLEAGQRVLWLIPGGSAIALAVAVGRRLPVAQLPGLTVTLTDERYGAVGHHDSNWRQLTEAGLHLPGAHLQPVLTGASLADTTAHFAEQLAADLTAADYRLGFFGIGPDGHTAGILPHSPAVVATALAAGYDGGTFQRITMTPAAIARLDAAIAYAAGQPKWPVLDQLDQPIDLEIMPAQSLKTAKITLIFNDHRGQPATSL